MSDEPDQPTPSPFPTAMAPIPQPPMVAPPPPAAVFTPAPPKKNWKPWVVVGVLVALVAAMFVARTLQKDPPTFPTFAEKRPSFGTIRVRTDYEEMLGQSYTTTTESNAAGSVVHVKGIETASPLEATSGGPFEVIVSEDELWAYDDANSEWVKRAEPDAGIFLNARYPLATLMVSDYVPDSLREFVIVKSVKDETVSGQAVKVYDLRVNALGYKESGAADYQEWADNLGVTDPKGNTTLELAIDANGVVWRMRSFSTLGTTQSRSSSFEQLLEKLLPEEFEPPYPTSYYDEATGQQVG